MPNRQDFSKAFKIGEVIESGADPTRKNAAHLQILAIEQDSVRYQSIKTQNKNACKFDYLDLLITNFDDIDPKSIQNSVNAIRKLAGLELDTSTENYAYTLAKAYVKRTQQAFFTSAGESVAPDQSLEEDQEFWEGVRIKIVAERIERSEKAREQCIREHKAICKICSFNFEDVYGAIRKGFIHVHHHTVQLSETVGKHRLDPKADLIPVCPNCHAMIHKRKPMFSVDEVRKMLQSR